MPSLQLSGLASGFDWKSVVDQLIALERVPQDQLRTRKNSNLGKLSTFATLRTRLGDLNNAAKDLTATSLFSQRSVTLANADLGWSATASNGATAGEYTFNVTQLATRSVRTGGDSRASALHDSATVDDVLVADLRLAMPVTDGHFSVNGASIDVAGTDSLQDVFDRIATATGGDVTAAYDPATDRVTLTSAATISLGSGADTSNFLYAFKLYNNGSSTVGSSTRLGTLNLDETIAAAGLATAVTGVDAEGNGALQINGVAVSYNVNTDTLRTVMERVTSSAAGVNLRYDASGDRFTLTDKATGDLDIAVADTTGSLLASLGLGAGATVTRGTNAEFSVNGGATIVSASNTFDATVHGITGLSVTADSEDEQTVTVSADTDALEQGIKTFIEKYNAVQQYIDAQTKVTVGTDGKVTAAPMAGNRELSELARQLRSRVFASVPALTGTIQRLESLGIDFDGSSSELAVQDAADLSNALRDNLDDVAALFTTATDGISARLQTYITQLTDTSGVLDTQETSLEKQNTSLDNQINELERRLEAERTRLEDSFIRMEQAQSLIQSQLSALQQTLNLG